MCWCFFTLKIAFLFGVVFFKMVFLAGFGVFFQNGAPNGCKMCVHLVFFLQNCARIWCKARRAGGGCMCGRCEVMWGGGWCGTGHRVN